MVVKIVMHKNSALEYSQRTILSLLLVEWYATVKLLHDSLIPANNREKFAFSTKNSMIVSRRYFSTVLKFIY